MKTVAITWWIISALIVVRSEGEITSDFSENQNKSLQLILEHFHNKDHIKNGFKVSDILKSIEVDYSSGVFVNLEFALKQTTCHKTHRTKTDCELVKNGRTFNCFACFKFSYNSPKILSQLIDCVNILQVDSKRTNRRNQSCKEVELKKGSEKVGSYSFLTSQ
ncbi:retinoic acid receptor responder protein 2-like [Eleutherodactylus coqui]|uniref:Retinoic acid receptor responder protein 2 n=1 Tax=Eleutherodactylus coqui TaxID=57060 RepID=A0A8J6EPP5_ELECQ|nr:hypothetical protein GDO78_017448 [Eleutherodactylus coqui]